MKIQYISHEYGERRLKYARVLQDLGHHVDLIKIRKKNIPGQVTVEHFNSSYDVVWIFSVDYIRQGVMTREFIDAVKESPAVFTGALHISVGTPFDEWVKDCCFFDVWFTPSRMIAEMASERCPGPVHAVPYGYDPHDYYPMQKKKKWDVTFMGSAQTLVPAEEDLRVRLLNSLCSFNIRVFGDKLLRKRLHPSIRVTPFSTHRKQNAVYNQSRINLDIPYLNSVLPEYRGRYHPKNRFLEIPGSGNFLLNAYSDEFTAVLEENVHCGYYHPETIGDSIEYFLSNEKERQEIARTGYGHVRGHYQNKHCFKRMADIVQKYVSTR